MGFFFLKVYFSKYIKKRSQLSIKYFQKWNHLNFGHEIRQCCFLNCVSFMRDLYRYPLNISVLYIRTDLIFIFIGLSDFVRNLIIRVLIICKTKLSLRSIKHHAILMYETLSVIAQHILSLAIR